MKIKCQAGEHSYKIIRVFHAQDLIDLMNGTVQYLRVKCIDCDDCQTVSKQTLTAELQAHSSRKAAL